MKFKSPIFFSLLVLTLFSFSCSHSGKPDVNSMTEAEVNLELSSFPSIGFGILLQLPEIHPSDAIFEQAKNFEQEKVSNKYMFRNEKPDVQKSIAEHAAEYEHAYYDSLPEQLKQEKKQLRDAYINFNKQCEKVKPTLPPRGQALIDRKISFMKSHMKKQLSKYDYVLAHLDTIIREAKKKARKSASK